MNAWSITRGRIAAGAALWFLSASVVGPTLAAPASHFEYAVIRNGDQIGSHVLDFNRAGDSIEVRIATNIQVKVAFFTVYRFEHNGVESWRKDRLVALKSRTNDNGTAHALSVAEEAGKLRINGDGAVAFADPAIIPGSLWNPAVVRQSIILNSLDGSQMKVVIKDMGEERVHARESDVSARHYRISGQLGRDVWFDRNGTLVRMHLKGQDDSDIYYELK